MVVCSSCNNSNHRRQAPAVKPSTWPGICPRKFAGNCLSQSQDKATYYATSKTPLSNELQRIGGIRLSPLVCDRCHANITKAARTKANLKRGPEMPCQSPLSQSPMAPPARGCSQTPPTCTPSTTRSDSLPEKSALELRRKAIQDRNVALTEDIRTCKQDVRALKAEVVTLRQQNFHLTRALASFTPDSNPKPTSTPGPNRGPIRVARAEACVAAMRIIAKEEDLSSTFEDIIQRTYTCKRRKGTHHPAPIPDCLDGKQLTDAVEHCFGQVVGAAAVTPEEMVKFRYYTAYGATHRVWHTIWSVLSANMKKCSTVKQALAWRDSLALPDIFYSPAKSGISVDPASVCSLVASNALLWSRMQFPTQTEDCLVLALSGDGVAEFGSWNGRSLNHFEMRFVNAGRMIQSPYQCMPLYINAGKENGDNVRYFFNRADEEGNSMASRLRKLDQGMALTLPDGTVRLFQCKKCFLADLKLMALMLGLGGPQSTHGCYCCTCHKADRHHFFSDKPRGCMPRSYKRRFCSHKQGKCACIDHAWEKLKERFPVMPPPNERSIPVPPESRKYPDKGKVRRFMKPWYNVNAPRIDIGVPMEHYFADPEHLYLDITTAIMWPLLQEMFEIDDRTDELRTIIRTHDNWKALRKLEPHKDSKNDPKLSRGKDDREKKKKDPTYTGEVDDLSPEDEADGAGRCTNFALTGGDCDVLLSPGVWDTLVSVLFRAKPGRPLTSREWENGARLLRLRATFVRAAGIMRKVHVERNMSGEFKSAAQDFFAEFRTINVETGVGSYRDWVTWPLHTFAEHVGDHINVIWTEFGCSYGMLSLQVAEHFGKVLKTLLTRHSNRKRDKSSIKNHMYYQAARDVYVLGVHHAHGVADVDASGNPKTARKLRKCGGCGLPGHQKNNQLCKVSEPYVKKEKAEADLAQLSQLNLTCNCPTAGAAAAGSPSAAQLATGNTPEEESGGIDW